MNPPKDAACPKCEEIPIDDDWWLIRTKWRHYIGYASVLRCECGTVSRWDVCEDGFVLAEVSFPKKRCG